MNKKLITLILFTLGFFSTDKAQEINPITKDKAINLVQSFYKGLKETVYIDINNLYTHRDSKITPFLISPDVFQHPNEWSRIIPDDESNSSRNSILINTHIGNLNRLGHDSNLRFDFSICNVSELREVQLEDMREKVVVTYWELTVNKSYSLNGYKYSFVDTVDVKIGNGKIALISNDIYCNQRPKPKIDDLREREAWHNEQITRAARCWSQGRKRDAYNIYVNAVEDFEDRDVYFRIGIILHNHYKECTNLKKKEAMALAYSYFDKAWKAGHPDAKRIMDNWWGQRGHAI